MSKRRRRQRRRARMSAAAKAGIHGDPGRAPVPAHTSSDDRGGVSAEAALAMPSLVLVFGMLLWATTILADQLNCIDAARVAARAAARGESDVVAVAAAQQVAPDGATVEITHDGHWVQVVVTAEVRPDGPIVRLVPSVPVRASAVVTAE